MGDICNPCNPCCRQNECCRGGIFESSAVVWIIIAIVVIYAISDNCNTSCC